MERVEPIRDMEEIKNIREVLSKNTKHELLFILGINTGLRISDIRNLKFSDILTDRFEIKESIMITEQKTNKKKKFYLSDTVKKVFKKYLHECKIGLCLDEYIFASQVTGKPISRQQAYRIINNAGVKIGIVKRDKFGKLVEGSLGTHSLRKTFAYHTFQSATNKGATIALLMHLLNHSSEAHTLRYIGITEDQKKEAYLNSNLGA